MTSQTDKLFQKKLENFQCQAPSAAWERIESNLDKTSSKAIWFKIAAGVLLLSVAAFILWPTSISKEKELAKSTEKNSTPSAKAEDVQKTISPIVANQRTDQKIRSPKKKNTLKEEPLLPKEKTKDNSDNKNSLEVSPLETPALTIATIATIETPAVVEASSSKAIVYTAEEVNSKYLRKKSTVDATTDEKKSSGMQKLIGLAYALKNTDSGLSDLRQKKDEILALNFLNEDTNNKRKN